MYTLEAAIDYYEVPSDPGGDFYKEVPPEEKARLKRDLDSLREHSKHWLQLLKRFERTVEQQEGNAQLGKWVRNYIEHHADPGFHVDFEPVRSWDTFTEKFDVLDGFLLMDGERVECIWPDGQTGEGLIRIKEKSDMTYDMGANIPLMTRTSYLETTVHGATTSVRLRKGKLASRIRLKRVNPPTGKRVEFSDIRA